MQTQGSLQESDLASLLQTMQSERATGTLTLDHDADNVSLYFLFGHLFHAAGPGGDGEDVVIDALGWRDGSFHFDPRAKLPAEETIKSSPAELIAAAEQSGGAAATAAPLPALRALDTGSLEAAEDNGAAASASVWSPAGVTPAQEPAQPAPGTWSSPAPAPAYTPTAYSPSYVPAEPAPASASTRPAARAAGGHDAPPVGVLPIPAGKAQYEGLKSAFVDFPRLLRTLRGEHHTGYIRLVTGSTSGTLLFADGELVEAEGGDDGALHGEAAFTAFRRQMDTGEGLIDVVDLEAETVTAVARLITGPPVFSGLLARFVNFPALLEYLEEQRLDGSVIVAGGSQTGVILLSDGNVLAAYTADARTPQSSTDAVATLAAERSAVIEVRGDDSSRGGIDIEAALSRPR